MLPNLQIEIEHELEQALKGHGIASEDARTAARNALRAVCATFTESYTVVVTPNDVALVSLMVEGRPYDFSFEI